MITINFFKKFLDKIRFEAACLILNLTLNNLMLRDADAIKIDQF